MSGDGFSASSGDSGAFGDASMYGDDGDQGGEQFAGDVDQGGEQHGESGGFDSARVEAASQLVSDFPELAEQANAESLISTTQELAHGLASELGVPAQYADAFASHPVLWRIIRLASDHPSVRQGGGGQSGQGGNAPRDPHAEFKHALTGGDRRGRQALPF